MVRGGCVAEGFELADLTGYVRCCDKLAMSMWNVLIAESEAPPVPSTG